MKTAVKKKLYEGMFLVDSAEAEADWDGVETNIKNILERVEAEIISIRKWDTRRLAYEIDKKSRGTYILCYFRAEGKSIAEIERTVHLSERIMRVLILSAEHMTEDDIEKDTPVKLAEKPGQKAAESTAAKAEVKQVSAVESSQTQDAVLEVSEAATESETLAESIEEAESDNEHLGTAEPAAADAGESEQTEEGEMKKDSESAEQQDKEGTDEK